MVFYGDFLMHFDLSGYVNDRHYYAKLELFGDIIAERCSWEIKCNEPVMKLMKKEKQDWRTLLKHKASRSHSERLQYINHAVLSGIKLMLMTCDE